MSYGWTAIFVEDGVSPHVMGSIRDKTLGDKIEKLHPDVDMGGKRWRWHSIGAHHVMFTLLPESKDDAPVRPVLQLHMHSEGHIALREHGFYWVAPKGDYMPDWEVAFYKVSYSGTGWYRPGMEGSLTDEAFRKIGAIVRRSPVAEPVAA